jgi:chromosome segregation ATPase
LKRKINQANSNIRKLTVESRVNDDNIREQKSRLDNMRAEISELSREISGNGAAIAELTRQTNKTETAIDQLEEWLHILDRIVPAVQERT